MKISLNIEMPPPPAKEKASSEPVQPKQSVEERVREAIEECESGRDSRQDWIMLGRLRTSLLALQKSAKDKAKKKRISNLLDMIDPLLTKYGYAGVSPEEK